MSGILQVISIGSAAANDRYSPPRLGSPDRGL